MPHPPISLRWTGSVFEPTTRRFSEMAESNYDIGETAIFVEHEERSSRSHGHFFASLREAWNNLPEDLSADFKTPESLRKYALIKTGYANHRSIVCSSKEEAMKIGPFIKSMDEYAIVTMSDNCVIHVYTAMSQSSKAMGKKEFQESKTAVLDFIASLVGVTSDELQKNAGRAA